MDNQIEYAINKLTPSFKGGLILYVWTSMFLLLGFVHISFVVIGILLLLFVLLYLVKTFNKRKQMTFIKDNYKTDIQAVLDLVTEKIEDLKRGISSSTFVAPTVGKDLGEATTNDESQQNLLRLWILLKENILTYHRINTSK